MIERYSNGREAIVYKNGENHVVRLQTWLSEKEAIRKFTNLKIASLLFPEHFIKLVDFRLEESSIEARPAADNSLYVNSYIKSELAPTHPDHAIYSKHYKRDNKGINCDCEVCTQHRYLHSSPEYIELLNIAKKKLEAAGLLIPDDDSTDHCVGPDGIIFFEIVAINQRLLWNYLNTLNESETARTAKALIDYQNMMKDGLTTTESVLLARKKYPDLNLVDYSLNS